MAGSEPEGATGPRQRIERVAGSRRARLTAAPGTEPEPHLDGGAVDGGGLDGVGSPVPESGPNDERMRREVPPHY